MKSINKNNMNNSSYRRNKTTRDFLLSFFTPEERYSEKEVNGFILIKQFSNFVWNVAIFSKNAYLKRKKHQNDFSNVFKTKTRGNSESEYK